MNLSKQHVIELIVTIIIVVALICFLLCYKKHKTKLEGGKFKYSIVEDRLELNDNDYITTNQPIMRYGDENHDMGINTTPDIFWKVVFIKLLNDNLDENYSFLVEDDIDFRLLNDKNDLKQTDFELDYQSDILSHISKVPSKICNIEYNENYFTSHFLKCINTDVINIIRLYTNIQTNSININDMKQYALNDFKFTHFHFNYSNGLLFDSLECFPNLQQQIKEYLRNIDTLDNGIIAINIFNFNWDYYYNIIEYKPKTKIKNLFEYYWFIVNTHFYNKYAYNLNYTTQTEKLSIKDNKIHDLKRFKITIDNNKIRIIKNKTELEFEKESDYLYNKSFNDSNYILMMVKMFNTPHYKKHIPIILKTFKNIDLNKAHTLSIPCDKINTTSYEGFYFPLDDDYMKTTIKLKNNKSWLVPNPDNILFKP